MWGLVILASFFVVSLFRAAFRRANLPKSLPWVGKTSNAPFSELRANLASSTNFKKWLSEGYARVRRQTGAVHWL